ncbi:MAG: aminotransferase class I/II-fold pyridoxal phosphate-dependent enzyme [Solirubrobacteraceae bacterium]
MIRFQTPQLPPVAEIAAYYARSEEARWFSNRGPCHELLTERLERFLGPGVRCVPVGNATVGLMLGLRALVGDRPQRREVLLPSFTFAATISAVLWAGLEPVFVDVEEHSWHLDPFALRAALAGRSDRVGAVLACSTFGVPPAMAQRGAWELAAREAGVPLLVDSAAGFGATAEDGLPLARQGDAEVFSFHATKPFAIGEGGLLTTTREDVADRAMRLANFGFEDGVVHGAPGLNAKLPEWPAATALAVLDRYDEVLAARRAAAAEILEAAAPDGYTGQSGTAGAAWQFVPVLAPSARVRDAALEHARGRGIELRTYFSVPLHRMPAYGSVPIAGGLARTEDLAARALSLPMANDQSAADREAIVACLAAAVRRAGQPVGGSRRP